MFYAVTTDRKLTRIQGSITDTQEYTPAASTAPPDGHVGLYFEGAGNITFTIGGNAGEVIAVVAGSYLWGTFDSVTAWSGTAGHVHAVMGSKTSLGQHPHEQARVRSTIDDYHEMTLAANTDTSLPDGTIGVFIVTAGSYDFTYKGATAARSITTAAGQTVWGEFASIESASTPTVYAVVSDREVLRPTSIRG